MAAAIKGTVKILFDPLARILDVVHVAVIPLLEQDHPLLFTGKLPNEVPVGIFTTTVINPVEGADPMLLTVTGIKLACPTTGLGEG